MYEYNTVIEIRELKLKYTLSETLPDALSVISETNNFIIHVLRRTRDTFIYSMVTDDLSKILYNNSYLSKKSGSVILDTEVSGLSLRITMKKLND